jgi:hypothetical protein
LAVCRWTMTLPVRYRRFRNRSERSLPPTRRNHSLYHFSMRSLGWLRSMPWVAKSRHQVDDVADDADALVGVHRRLDDVLRLGGQRLVRRKCRSRAAEPVADRHVVRGDVQEDVRPVGADDRLDRRRAFATGLAHGQGPPRSSFLPGDEHRRRAARGRPWRACRAHGGGPMGIAVGLRSHRGIHRPGGRPAFHHRPVPVAAAELLPPLLGPPAAGRHLATHMAPPAPFPRPGRGRTRRPGGTPAPLRARCSVRAVMLAMSRAE